MNSLLKWLSWIVKNDLLIPVFFILVYLVFIVIIRGSLPTTDELIEAFALLYTRFGYEIVFVAAALEGLVLVNFFVPGMITMALGAIFARAGVMDLTFVVLAASGGAIVGYTLDFLLGYFGFSEIFKKLGYSKILAQAREKLLKFKNRALILGFAYPNIASLLSLAAGAIGIKFSQFFLIALFSTLAWMSVWGLVFYMVGEVILNVLRKYSFLVVLGVLAGLFLVRLWNDKKKN